MKRIITIARQYESMGSEIGQKLSEITGIPVYDKEALVNIAEEHGIPRDTFEKADEQATSSFLYSLAMSNYSGSVIHFGTHDDILTDRVFNIQSAEIKKIAEAGDGIIIGRCADDVLSGCEGLLRVYIYAPIEKRIENYKNSFPGTDDGAARKAILKTDKKRASYYNFYTGKNWGDPQNFDLMIDSGRFGIEGSARLIASSLEIIKYNTFI